MAKDPEVNIREADLVFFDTETTGLNFSHELIEIGLVKVKAKTFEVLAERDIKIKPAHIETADAEALRIVGYDHDEWMRDGVDLKTGLEEFLSYTESVVLVGHNLPFDWMHVRKSLEECGLRPNYFYKGFDTFPMAWQKLRNDSRFLKFSLEELGNYFGIDRGRAHRAIDDARTTYQVFRKLIES
ncbi:MAG: 3'-5' exonuclease [Patescibacteria group bacterium]